MLNPYIYIYSYMCDCANMIKKTRKQAFLVSVRGVISPEVHMIPGDEGEFHYSYRTARAGIYFVSSLYDGVDIGGSPFKLTVDPVCVRESARPRMCRVGGGVKPPLNPKP